jgi:hypothetical protein
MLYGYQRIAESQSPGDCFLQDTAAQAVVRSR